MRKNKSAVPVGPVLSVPSLGQSNPLLEDMMSKHELTLTRLLDAPADKLFRCWTTPDLLKHWFAPRPYTTPAVEMELGAGGAGKIVMRRPEGQEISCAGQYLEIVPNRKIVFANAFTGDRVPKDGAPFMVAAITIEPEGDKTRCVATAGHCSEEGCAKHEQMGFYPGWGLCAEQLEAVAKTI
jgi:uncharacterized protein YndB with AHSA1/START domain